LFEIIGYALYPRYDLHKAVMLVGSGANGKSTYLRLIKDILGARNVSNIPLQELTNPDKNRFSPSMLYHKLANIFGDLPREALRDTSLFKVLVGEDRLCSDRKYKSPICFYNYAKLIFSANELPQVYDMSFAFWRRWLVIEFPNQFPIDPEFYERTFTEEEIEGVILVSLIAFREAWRRRRFSFEETQADYKEIWLRSANPTYDCIIALVKGEARELIGYVARLNPNAYTDTKELYTVCSQYWEKVDREAPYKNVFTMELERLFGIKRVAKKGYYYYKGIELERVGAPPSDLEDYI